MRGRPVGETVAVYVFLLTAVASILTPVATALINAVAFRLPAPPALTGPLSANQLLEQAERLLDTKIAATHSFVSVGEQLFAVTAEGLVVDLAQCPTRIVVDLKPRGCKGAGGQITSKKCGHLMSIRLHPLTKKLIVLDGKRGLFEVDPSSGVVVQLWNADRPVQGRRTQLMTDFVITANGDIILADASPIFDFDQEFWIRFEGKADGRLLKFNSTTRQMQELATLLAYPTGLEITTDSRGLLVSEANRVRILKFSLIPPHTRSVWAVNLPGMPEHIRQSGRGSYWVGLTYPRHRGDVSVLDQYSTNARSRNFLANSGQRTMSQLKAMFVVKGLAVELDQSGNVVNSLHDQTGLSVKEVTEVMENSRVAYVGSRGQQAVVRTVLPLSFGAKYSADSYVQVLRSQCKIDEATQFKQRLQMAGTMKKTQNSPSQRYSMSGAQTQQGYSAIQPTLVVNMVPKSSATRSTNARYMTKPTPYQFKSVQHSTINSVPKQRHIPAPSRVSSLPVVQRAKPVHQINSAQYQVRQTQQRKHAPAVQVQKINRVQQIRQVRQVHPVQQMYALHPPPMPPKSAHIQQPVYRHAPQQPRPGYPMQAPPQGYNSGAYSHPRYVQPAARMSIRQNQMQQQFKYNQQIHSAPMYGSKPPYIPPLPYTQYQPPKVNNQNPNFAQQGYHNTQEAPRKQGDFPFGIDPFSEGPPVDLPATQMAYSDKLVIDKFKSNTSAPEVIIETVTTPQTPNENQPSNNQPIYEHIQNQNVDIIKQLQTEYNNRQAKNNPPQQNQQAINNQHQLMQHNQHAMNNQQQTMPQNQHAINNQQQTMQQNQHVMNNQQHIMQQNQHAMNNQQQTMQQNQHAMNNQPQPMQQNQHAINNQQQIMQQNQHAINHQSQIMQQNQQAINHQSQPMQQNQQAINHQPQPSMNNYQLQQMQPRNNQFQQNQNIPKSTNKNIPNPTNKNIRKATNQNIPNRPFQNLPNPAPQNLQNTAPQNMPNPPSQNSFVPKRSVYVPTSTKPPMRYVYQRPVTPATQSFSFKKLKYNLSKIKDVLQSLPKSDGEPVEKQETTPPKVQQQTDTQNLPKGGFFVFMKTTTLAPTKEPKCDSYASCARSPDQIPFSVDAGTSWGVNFGPSSADNSNQQTNQYFGGFADQTPVTPNRSSDVQKPQSSNTENSRVNDTPVNPNSLSGVQESQKLPNTDKVSGFVDQTPVKPNRSSGVQVSQPPKIENIGGFGDRTPVNPNRSSGVQISQKLSNTENVGGFVDQMPVKPSRSSGVQKPQSLNTQNTNAHSREFTKSPPVTNPSTNNPNRQSTIGQRLQEIFRKRLMKTSSMLPTRNQASKVVNGQSLQRLTGTGQKSNGFVSSVNKNTGGTQVNNGQTMQTNIQNQAGEKEAFSYINSIKPQVGRNIGQNNVQTGKTQTQQPQAFNSAAAAIHPNQAHSNTIGSNEPKTMFQVLTSETGSPATAASSQMKQGGGSAVTQSNTAQQSFVQLYKENGESIRIPINHPGLIKLLQGGLTPHVAASIIKQQEMSSQNGQNQKEVSGQNTPQNTFETNWQASTAVKYTPPPFSP